MTKTLALLLALFPVAALAQNAPPTSMPPSAPGPLVVERVHNPFVVAPDYKVTDINGNTGQLAGGYAGRVFGDSVFIGGAGYGLAGGSGGDELAYGGVLAGWSMPAGSRIRFGARALVGAGQATLGTDVVVNGGGIDPRGGDPRGNLRGIDPRLTRFGVPSRGVNTAVPTTIRLRAQDTFAVFEPQADLLTRLTSHIAVSWAAGYRLTGATDLPSDRLDGATGSVALQLEW